MPIKTMNQLKFLSGEISTPIREPAVCPKRPALLKSPIEAHPCVKDNIITLITNNFLLDIMASIIKVICVTLLYATIFLVSD